MKHILLTAFFSASSFAADPIRGLVWDEQQPAQKTAYGENVLGETIAAHLGKLPGISVKTANPALPEQGLDTATLNATDVVIWPGRQKQRDVKDEFAERVAQRVQEGRLGLVALHSAHWAKPFVRLMQERAKADALVQIPAAERATAQIESMNHSRPSAAGVVRSILCARCVPRILVERRDAAAERESRIGK